VGPVVVVVVQPSREGVKALLVGEVGAGVGPFALQGQVQPLDLGVGLGPVGSGALVGHPGPSQDLAEASRAVAVAIIGQDPLDLDAQLGIAGQRSPGKAGHRAGALVGMDLQIGHPGTVINGGVDEVIAQALLGPTTPATVPPMDPVAATIGDATLLLDIQVHQLPRPLTLVADHLPGGPVQVSELAVPDAAIVAPEVRAGEIRDVLAKPGWQWLTEAVRTAWEADLSRRRVRIDVDRLTADQTTAMANFLHWPTHRQGVVTVDLGSLDARLRASGLAAGLATCLTVSGGPLADVAGDRRAAGAARRVAAETLWARAKEHPAIARHPTLVGWLDDERAAGRLPAEPATRARVLGEALDVLAVLPDEGTGLARVATGVLGYAHALNAGTVPAAVLRAAGWLAGEPATAPSSEMRRRLWASLGVATDMVSSTVLVLGVTLVGDSPLAVSLAAHAAAGVPMRVTLGQLVHHVERAELRGPRRVWACENPSVVEAGWTSQRAFSCWVDSHGG
jgi:uncharacterized protein (TIGR02679 family)